MDLARRRKKSASPLLRKLPFVILVVHLQAIMMTLMMVMMRRDIMIIAMMLLKMPMPVIYLEAISRGQPLLLAVMEDTLTKKMLRYFAWTYLTSDQGV